jgi:hypothetical protein
MIGPSVIDHDVKMNMILKWNFNLISFPARKDLRLNEESLPRSRKGYMFLFLFLFLFFFFLKTKGKEYPSI